MNKIKVLSKKFIAFFCMITLVFSVSVVRETKAAALTLLSDTMTDSRPSQYPNHDIKFKMDASTTIANTETLSVTFTGFTTGATAITDGDWGIFHDADGSGAYTALTLTTHYTISEPAISTANPVVTFTFTSTGATAIGTNKYLQITLTNSSDKLPNPAASVNTISIGGNFGDTGSMKVAVISGVAVSAVVAESLTFSVNAVASGQTVNGATTNVATTDGTAVAFGTVDSGTNKIAAHDLTVDTNASGGYTTTTEYTQALTSGSDTITDFTGTNASPASFSAAGTEAFGYTTNDATLQSVAVDRFTNPANGWAKFTTAPLEVAYSNSAVSSQTTRIGYQVGIAGATEAGTYTTTVIYITTPIY